MIRRIVATLSFLRHITASGKVGQMAGQRYRLPPPANVKNAGYVTATLQHCNTGVVKTCW